MKNKTTEYKNLYEEVRRISNTHDLMGLIRIGSPDDEYDPETSRILQLIDKSKNVGDLAAGIATIYNKMFDADFKPSDKWISNIATDIFKLKEV